MVYFKTIWKRIKQQRSLLQTPEGLYIAAALLFGFLFVVVMPPFYNADESNHLLRAYQLSDGNLFSDTISTGVGGKVPQSFVKTIDKADISLLFQQKTKRSVDLHDSKVLDIGLERGKTTPVPFPNTSIYSPVVYAHYIPFLEILKLFNSPPIVMLYVCRIVSLLLATILVFLAIRTIPIGKWALVAIGLIPMTVSSFASVSADGVTIGLCLLATAYTMKLAYQARELDRGQLIRLCLLFTGVALSKTTYILFIALGVLIILLNKYARSKQSIIKISAVVAAAGLAGLAWQAATGYIKNINSDPLVNPSAQLHLILHHPIGFLKGPFQSSLLSNQHNGIVESTYGFFASLTTPLPYVYVLLSSFVVMFSLLAVSPLEFKDIRKKFAMPGRLPRLLALAIAVGTIGLMSVALYMYWTPVGAPVIAGLQGRYFIPLLGLGILLFRTDKIVVDEAFRKKLVLGLSIFVLSVSLLVCITRFYVTPS